MKHNRKSNYVSDHTSQQNAMPFDVMQYHKVLCSYSTSGRAELEIVWLEIIANLPFGVG